jgi:hypothetical protein
MVEFSRKDRAAYKRNNEWSAESRLEFTGTNRVVKVSTHKRQGGLLVTSADVWHTEGGFDQWAPFSAFSEVMARSKPGRVTEKTINEQHHEAMTRINDVIERVVAFYMGKESE